MKKVGSMRQDTSQDKLHNKPRQERNEKAITLADLCEAIEARRLRATREGNDYVVRKADVRRLWDEAIGKHADRPEAPGCPDALEVGRSA